VRIYGPFSKTFTIRPLQAMLDGRFALQGDADVPANMVYVDNVVEAIARAIEAGDERSGSPYLVSDAEQVSLREFFGYFAAAGQHDPIRVVPAPAANGESAAPPGLAGRWVGGLKSIATSPELRAMVRRVFNTDPIGTWPRKWWEASPARQEALLRRFGADAAVVYRPAAPEGSEDLLYYGEPARVSIDRARAELGFEPLVSRDRAMALTLEWARAARLVRP
jgi:nucleoside-diphosphate-sugar epimerase